jgi:hypothetical protein
MGSGRTKTTLKSVSSFIIDLLGVLGLTLLFFAVLAILILLPPFLFQLGWNYVIIDFGAPVLTYPKAIVLFWMWILLIKPAALAAKLYK